MTVPRRCPTVPRGTTARSEPPPPIADPYFPRPRPGRRRPGRDESDSRPSDPRGASARWLVLALAVNAIQESSQAIISLGEQDNYTGLDVALDGHLSVSC